MVKREDVEALLATCEQIHKPNNGVIAECCRAWLALDAAPEVLIGGADGLSAFLVKRGKKPLPSMYGQRVRLVATPTSGGPRDERR